MKTINEGPRQEFGVKPIDINIGDLLFHLDVGQCIAMEWFAPALLGVVIVDPSKPNTSGEWRYIRGHEFEATYIIAKGENDENNRL
tara:strand:- start:4302 stop:4559 length:258 start_codon:yes stop_codon:yes gene_type:complete